MSEVCPKPHMVDDRRSSRFAADQNLLHVKLTNTHPRDRIIQEDQGHGGRSCTRSVATRAWGLSRELGSNNAVALCGCCSGSLASDVRVEKCLGIEALMAGGSFV